MSVNYDEDDDLTEDERIAKEKKANSRLRASGRRLRTAMLDMITKGKESEEFPNLDGSNKQTYAIVAVLDGQDRDVAESEKAMNDKQSNEVNGAMVAAMHNRLIENAGDPSKIFAHGERGMRTVGDSSKRLLPERQATGQHMKIGADEIDFETVYNKDNAEDE